MKHLILDHYRRWSWVLMFVAVAEFGLGWLIALGPEYTYEFWTFCLALWSGAVLLSFDFQRGLLRPLAALPLTGRQLGRSWWTGTVIIPAIALTVLMFFGAAACCHFRPSHTFPTERLALGSLFGFVWLGLTFAMILNTARGFGTNWREFISNSVLSWFTVLMFFGSMLFCLDASKSATRSAIILILGGLLTAVGLHRAWRFDSGRAGFYLGRIEPPNLRRESARQTPPELKTLSGRGEALRGYGGMRFLVSTLFVRAFLNLVFLASLLALVTVVQRQVLRNAPELKMMAIVGSFMSCWFLVFFQFMPLLRHLRLLRTLPVSPAGLAAVLLVLVVLPLLALGALVTTVVWLTLGAPTALSFLTCGTFVLAFGALGAFFAVWRGAGIQGYALLMVSLVGSTVAFMSLASHFPSQELPLRVAAAIAVAGLLLAFVLIRLVLIHNSQVYRIQADPFGRVLQPK